MNESNCFVYFNTPDLQVTCYCFLCLQKLQIWYLYQQIRDKDENKRNNLEQLQMETITWNILLPNSAHCNHTKPKAQSKNSTQVGNKPYDRYLLISPQNLYLTSWNKFKLYLLNFSHHWTVHVYIDHGKIFFRVFVHLVNEFSFW